MSRLLLDTHVFLWWVDDAPDLSISATRAIADTKNQCYLSITSCWEMAIKSSIGKLRLAKPLERFVSDQLAANGFSLLPIELHHVVKTEKLPYHHRDPFDRLLISQAISENLIIISADSIFSDYGTKVIW
jgi:PIN domain nuclease of toxin-antitoxin system